MQNRFLLVLGLSLAFLCAPIAVIIQDDRHHFAHSLIGVSAAEAQEITNQQRNAVRSAERYLQFHFFSREGLIEQLSSPFGDDYDRADAVAAVNSMSVDWNAQAVRAAENYLSLMGFSCRGLIEQLSSSFGEGFTQEQARYGAEQAGAC